MRARRLLGLRSWSTTSLAQAYVVLGRITDAREQAEQAVALARAHQQRGWEGWGLKLLGDVHAHKPAKGAVDQGGAEQAEKAYRRALMLAMELGMRPLVVHCHFGLGALYGRTSKRDQARRHFTLATTMYREMDMQFWQEQAEAALNEVRVL